MAAQSSIMKTKNEERESGEMVSLCFMLSLNKYIFPALMHYRGINVACFPNSFSAHLSPSPSPSPLLSPTRYRPSLNP